MRAFYSDRFVLPLPERHRFPMAKYRLLREAALERGVLDGRTLAEPPAALDRDLLRVHTRAYLAAVVTGGLERAAQRRIGFPWSAQLVERSRRSVGGTIAACRAALDDGVAVNLAGGTHHAFADRGEGFCVFNDAAVAARALRAEGRVRRVAILDCDVHQGNGTAAIFRDDPAVFTFSIHGARNFPFRKEASDLDVDLPDGTGDAAYLGALEAGLDATFARFPAPDLAIYLAGADPFEGDALGRLAVTKAGLAARDRLVLDRCRAARLPVAVAMAGGYAANVDDIVDIHLTTLALAAELLDTGIYSERSLEPSASA